MNHTPIPLTRQQYRPLNECPVCFSAENQATTRYHKHKTLTTVSDEFFLAVFGSGGLSGDGNRVIPLRCQQQTNSTRY